MRNSAEINGVHFSVDECVAIFNEAKNVLHYDQQVIKGYDELAMYLEEFKKRYGVIALIQLASFSLIYQSDEYFREGTGEYCQERNKGGRGCALWTKYTYIEGYSIEKLKSSRFYKDVEYCINKRCKSDSGIWYEVSEKHFQDLDKKLQEKIKESRKNAATKRNKELIEKTTEVKSKIMQMLEGLKGDQLIQLYNKVTKNACNEREIIRTKEEAEEYIKRYCKEYNYGPLTVIEVFKEIESPAIWGYAERDGKLEAINDIKWVDLSSLAGRIIKRAYPEVILTLPKPLQEEIYTWRDLNKRV